jgi:hypothetical protein
MLHDSRLVLSSSRRKKNCQLHRYVKKESLESIEGTMNSAFAQLQAFPGDLSKCDVGEVQANVCLKRLFNPRLYLEGMSLPFHSSGELYMRATALRTAVVIPVGPVQVHRACVEAVTGHAPSRSFHTRSNAAAKATVACNPSFPC